MGTKALKKNTGKAPRASQRHANQVTAREEKRNKEASCADVSVDALEEEQNRFREVFKDEK